MRQPVAKTPKRRAAYTTFDLMTTPSILLSIPAPGSAASAEARPCVIYGPHTGRPPHAEQPVLTHQDGSLARYGDRVVCALSLQHSEPPHRSWLDALAESGWDSGPASALRAHARDHFVVLGLDEATGQVFAATDRFSTRPVYWHRGAEQWLISTDLGLLVKALRTSPTPSPQALYDYLYFHNIPAPRTVYEGVYKLPPASVLVWESVIAPGAVAGVNSHGADEAVTIWWRPEPGPAEAQANAYDGKALLGALEQGINGQQPGPRTACFLSGGLDSSTVVELLGRSGRETHAFSIGFAGAEDYDELPFAEKSAAHAGASLHTQRLTPADLDQAIELITTGYDEPFGNSSAVPTLACARLAREAGFEHLFAGDGGDELFAGNERYAEQLKIARLARLAPLAHLAGWVAPNLPGLPLRSKSKRLAEIAGLDVPARLERYNFVHRLGVDALLTREFKCRVDIASPLNTKRARFMEGLSDADTLQAMLYLDWKFTLADSDLPKVTRMCDLAGVRVHYPLLTDAVVDFSLKVPSAQKLAKGELRAFYRNAMRGFLAPETLCKSKHGFGLPFGVWLGSDQKLRQRLDDSLASLGQRHLIQPELLRKVKTLVHEGHAGYFGELGWILMSLEHWLLAHAPDFRLAP